MTTRIADPQTRALANELVSLRREVDSIKAGGRATQLGYATVEEGQPVRFKNAQGDLMGVIGMVTPTDSNEAVFHIQPMSQTPPAAPPAPIVTAIADGLMVETTGTGQPVDYDHHRVYYGSGTLAGRLYGADSLPIAPLESDVPVPVWLTQVNTSGKESAQSPHVSVAPSKVVAKDVVDGIVTEVKIANDAVSAQKVKTGAITEIKIAPEAVTAAKVAANAIREVHIDNEAITAAKVKAGAVQAVHISDDAIEARHMTAGSVTAGTIAAGAVTAGTVAAGAITAESLAANSIEARHIVAGQIFAEHIAAGSIQAEHLTADSVTAHNIAANSITATELAAKSVLADKIAADQILARHITAQAITAEKIAALAITADKIAANSIDVGHLKAGSVTASKLEANMVLTSRIIVGSPSGNRLELHPTAGLQGWNQGVRRLWFDPQTGNLLATGTWRTGTYEDARERIEIAEDGTQTFIANNNFVAGKIENIGLQGLQFRSGKLGSNAGYLFLNSGYVGINWGTQGGTVPASFGCDAAGIQSWGRLIGMRYEARYAGDGTTPRIFMLGTDSSGGDIGSTVIHVQRRTSDNAAAITAPVQNCGFVFYPNEINVTTGNPSTFGPIRASAHTTPSSETLKHDIRDVRLAHGRTEWDAIEGAPALEWVYNADVTPQDTPETSDGEPIKLRRVHPEGGEYEVTAGFTAPPARQRRHFGPLAEDLHAVDPSLVVGDPSHPRRMATDPRDQVGILWAAMDRMIKRQRVMEQILLDHGIEMPAWPGKGDMVRGVGHHKRGRTKRSIDPETGQATRTVR